MTAAALDEWIARDAVPFDAGAAAEVDAAVDRLVGSLGDAVELLGFGEPLHGGEAVLILRNQLFQRLVAAHGYTAIAIESSFPRGRLADDYVAGRGPDAFDAVRDAGFSHGFGRLEANRELAEWMRRYNADPSHGIRLRFYGFDSPTEMYGTDSPRQSLDVALDYLTSVDGDIGQVHRDRIVPLLGADADWENPAALFDPAKSIGLSPAATALRMETEELISTLHVRRPDWVARSDRDTWLEAAQHAAVARQLLTYHAALARPSPQRFVTLLGIRDAMMADNLAYAVSRERGRGKVLAFAHNSHLKRGQAQWQLGPDLHAWWPAGSHLTEMLGPRYAVVGTAVGTSEANGIGAPEAGTLENRLTAAERSACFIPTHGGRGLPSSAIASLPTRPGSSRNPTYFPLTPRSFTDFDWLAVLRSTAYARGGPAIPS